MRPLLFLDVDGVLNACPPVPDVEVVEMLGFPICIPPDTPERIARLLEVFDPVWATTWRGDAHEHFAGPLGLTGEPWPHIEFLGGLKLPSIIDYAIGAHLPHRTEVRPWCFIDDDAMWEMREIGIWPDRTQSLVINPVTAKGLTDDHVNEALGFARRVKALREGP